MGLSLGLGVESKNDLSLVEGFLCERVLKKYLD